MPSSVPVIQAVKTITKRGVIEVKNSIGDCLGYISKNSLSKAQLQYESAIENATTVTFVIQESLISASQVRITMEDPDEIGFPLLGLLQAANDTSVDTVLESYNFLYLTGIAQPGSVAGAVPANISNAYTNATTSVRAPESDVWTINLTTGNLLPQWINSNGCKLGAHPHILQALKCLFIERPTSHQQRPSVTLNSDRLHWLCIANTALMILRRNDEDERAEVGQVHCDRAGASRGFETRDTLHHSKTLGFNHHDVADNIAMTRPLIRYSRDLSRSQPDRIQAEDSRVVWQNCVPHVAHFLPSNQPLDSLDPPPSNAYGTLIVIFTFPLTAYQGIANPKSRRLSPDRGSAVARDMLNARRTERLTRGDVCVEFVRVGEVLGGQCGFGGCVEREVTGAVEDEEPKGEKISATSAVDIICVIYNDENQDRRDRDQHCFTSSQNLNPQHLLPSALRARTSAGDSSTPSHPSTNFSGIEREPNVWARIEFSNRRQGNSKSLSFRRSDTICSAAHVLAGTLDHFIFSPSAMNSSIRRCILVGESNRRSNAFWHFDALVDWSVSEAFYPSVLFPGAVHQQKPFATMLSGRRGERDTDERAVGVLELFPHRRGLCLWRRGGASSCVARIEPAVEHGFKIEAMADECTSSAKGDGDDELVVTVKIKINVQISKLAHGRLFEHFYLNSTYLSITLPQTLQLPRMSFSHSTGHQVSLATQILHSQKIPSPDRSDRNAQPLIPPSIDDTTKYTHDGSASWHSTFNPLTPTPPSQHRLLILPCACDLPLRKTPKTALTTQHRLNAHRFNTIISTPDPRSGDKRRLFEFAMPWYAVRGKEKMTMEYAINCLMWREGIVHTLRFTCLSGVGPRVMCRSQSIVTCFDGNGNRTYLTTELTVALTSAPTYDSQLNVDVERIKLPGYTTTTRDPGKETPTVVQFCELTTLRREGPNEPTPHAADSMVGRSLALFVHLHHLSTNSGVAYSIMAS
ncbi:uncharacterized protein LACBIDRAFT_329911 [Laccaria bicolor S238N-H82]|uniref:Predicted protein n=1 Tax=Laccaria bicolor (strain S238N-H82 / ATCC MYA-4686) TaxID=486041 RepID=B0DJL5_LACBS|nr:uncharacterized protein LACBIDRAFT_329911 [Laccaria bicolor S238N-H82]EDR05229.1 predicted protein [Laccaria bicolor S238N-H82]|eukprot:XP_001884194.1 predicted protein [Laccaria bicolor S238N-H82]